MVTRFDRAKRLVRRTGPLALLVLAASGCDPSFGYPQAITPQGQRMRDLWIGSSIAALVVGVFVWGLMFYAMIRYRKRNDELPRQVRYNLPIEVLYTAVPFVIIGALFYYTARDEVYVDKVSKHPQVTVQVVGFRWSWQFNYLSDSPPGKLISVTGRPNQYPVLTLPAHETVLFKLTSADVTHDFWVPQLLFKRDNIPGRTNEFQVTIDKTGTYQGHCAQLCGMYHDRMLFWMHVVTPAQYRSYIAAMSAKAQGSGIVNSFPTPLQHGGTGTLVGARTGAGSPLATGSVPAGSTP